MRYVIWGLAVVFGVPLALVFVDIAAGLVYQIGAFARAEPAQAEVVAGKIEVYPAVGGTGTSYHPAIQFRYRTATGTAESEATYPLDLYESFTDVAPLKGISRADAEAVLEAYPRGKQVEAYIVSDEPGAAFLVKDVYGKPFIAAAVSGILLLVPLFLVVAAGEPLSRRKTPLPAPHAEGELLPEASPGKRFGQSLAALVYYAAVVLIPFGIYFAMANRPYEGNVTLVFAGLVAAGLIPGQLVRADLGFMRRFRGLRVFVEGPYPIRAGARVPVRIELTPRRAIHLNSCDVAMLRIDKTYEREGITIRIGDEEISRETERAAEDFQLQTSGPERFKTELQLTDSAPASSPPGQRAYPRHKYYIAVTINAPRCKNYELRYPITVES